MISQDDVRNQPLYTPADISRYAHVHAETLRTWTGGRGTPLISRAGSNTVAPFSFINLVEAHVLVAIRKTHEVPMQRVRKAVKWLRDGFHTQHPLAEVDLETDGRDLFVEYLNVKVSATDHGQIVIPEVISLYLQRIERDVAGPIRFYPITSSATCPRWIVMDPHVDFGRPVITRTRVETLMIFDRYSGGDSLTEIANDYSVELPAVEEALRCEMERRAA